MKSKKFSIKKRIESFKYAFSGLRILFNDEHNTWIHILCGILAVFLGFLFKISTFEWIAIIFAIGFVFTMEILNTVIENLSDRVSQEKDEFIKKAKDLSAAAVLVSAITALIVGLIIFVPKFMN